MLVGELNRGDAEGAEIAELDGVIRGDNHRISVENDQMKGTKQILMEFIEESTSAFDAFNTISGEHHEGWIECIVDDHAVVWTHGPMDTSQQPHRIPVSNIDVCTLVYFDEEKRKRIEFGQRLREEEQQ